MPYLKKRICISAVSTDVTPKDKQIFLKGSPNGQWLRIELETGMKISETIAKVLGNKQ
jgi:hypothetical protein